MKKLPRQSQWLAELVQKAKMGAMKNHRDKIIMQKHLTIALLLIGAVFTLSAVLLQQTENRISGFATLDTASKARVIKMDITNTGVLNGALWTSGGRTVYYLTYDKDSSGNYQWWYSSTSGDWKPASQLSSSKEDRQLLGEISTGMISQLATKPNIDEGLKTLADYVSADKWHNPNSYSPSKMTVYADDTKDAMVVYTLGTTTKQSDIDAFIGAAKQLTFAPTPAPDQVGPSNTNPPSPSSSGSSTGASQDVVTVQTTFPPPPAAMQAAADKYGIPVAYLQAMYYVESSNGQDPKKNNGVNVGDLAISPILLKDYNLNNKKAIPNADPKVSSDNYDIGAWDIATRIMSKIPAEATPTEKAGMMNLGFQLGPANIPTLDAYRATINNPDKLNEIYANAKMDNGQIGHQWAGDIAKQQTRMQKALSGFGSSLAAEAAVVVDKTLYVPYFKTAADGSQVMVFLKDGETPTDPNLKRVEGSVPKVAADWEQLYNFKSYGAMDVIILPYEAKDAKASAGGLITLELKSESKIPITPIPAPSLDAQQEAEAAASNRLHPEDVQKFLDILKKEGKTTPEDISSISSDPKKIAEQFARLGISSDGKVTPEKVEEAARILAPQISPAPQAVQVTAGQPFTVQFSPEFSSTYRIVKGTDPTGLYDTVEQLGSDGKWVLMEEQTAAAFTQYLQSSFQQQKGSDGKPMNVFVSNYMAPPQVQAIPDLQVITFDYGNGFKLEYRKNGDNVEMKIGNDWVEQHFLSASDLQSQVAQMQLKPGTTSTYVPSEPKLPAAVSPATKEQTQAVLDFNSKEATSRDKSAMELYLKSLGYDENQVKDIMQDPVKLSQWQSELVSQTGVTTANTDGKITQTTGDMALKYVNAVNLMSLPVQDQKRVTELGLTVNENGQWVRKDYQGTYEFAGDGVIKYTPNDKSQPAQYLAAGADSKGLWPTYVPKPKPTLNALESATVTGLNLKWNDQTGQFVQAGSADIYEINGDGTATKWHLEKANEYSAMFLPTGADPVKGWQYVGSNVNIDASGPDPDTGLYVFYDKDSTPIKAVVGNVLTTAKESDAGKLMLQMSDGEYREVQRNDDGTLQVKLQSNGQWTDYAGLQKSQVIGQTLDQAYEAASGGRALSILLGFDNNAWRRTMDLFFVHTVIGGVISGNWEESLCQHYIARPPEGTLYLTVPDGQNMVGMGAHVEAERTDLEFINNSGPQQQFFYKISLFVKNPEKPTKSGQSFVQQMDFNVQLTGPGVHATLFKQDQKVGPGQSFVKTGASVITQFSNNRYVQICIEFKNAVYTAEGDSVSEVCNAITGYNGPASAYTSTTTTSTTTSTTNQNQVNTI